MTQVRYEELIEIIYKEIRTEPVRFLIVNLAGFILAEFNMN